MSEISQNREQFTALILVTGVDRPGIAAGVFKTLAPFSVSIVDIEQITISDRLILTILLTLNPAHEKAVESDLNDCAAHLDVDIATLFTSSTLRGKSSDLVTVSIEATKLQPKHVALVTESLHAVSANIESITRQSSTPVSIDFIVSGCSLSELNSALFQLNFEDDTKIAIKERN